MDTINDQRRKPKLSPLLVKLRILLVCDPNTHNQLALPQKRSWDEMEDVKGCGVKTLRCFGLNGLDLALGWSEHLREEGLMMGGGAHLEQDFPEMEGRHQGSRDGCTGVLAGTQLCDFPQELGRWRACNGPWDSGSEGDT